MFEQANEGSTNNRNKRSRKEVVINKEWFFGRGEVMDERCYQSDSQLSPGANVPAKSFHTSI
jgi:hypothetical protein